MHVLKLLVCIRLLTLRLDEARGRRLGTTLTLCRSLRAGHILQRLAGQLLLLLLLLAFLLLGSHLLSLLSFAADQGHAVSDGLGHGFVVALTNIARLNLYLNIAYVTIYMCYI